MLFEAFVAAQLGQGVGPPPPDFACPDGMVPVAGTHVEQVQRLCLEYTQGHCLAFWPGAVAREGRVSPVRTCMDRYEWPNERGRVPVVMLRFVDAQRACADVGKRLCSENEWELACEGPLAWPFPYGHRHVEGTCNSDKPYKPPSEARLAADDSRTRDAETKRLWQGEPSGARPGCTSPFGVVDMSGNVEEWVTTSRPEWRYPSSLKGGYWSKPWAGCRGTNDSHGPQFRFYEIGFRCCRDPGPTTPKG